MFIIPLFTRLKITLVGAESTWKTYGAFLDSFHTKVKQLVLRLVLINYKKKTKGKCLSCLIINVTCVCVCVYVYIYIYIYIYINGDSSLFLLLVPPPPSVNFSSQPVVRES